MGYVVYLLVGLVAYVLAIGLLRQVRGEIVPDEREEVADWMMYLSVGLFFAVAWPVFFGLIVGFYLIYYPAKYLNERFGR